MNGDGVDEGVLTVDLFNRDSVGEIKDHDSVAWIMGCVEGEFQVLFEESGGTLRLLQKDPVVLVDFDNDQNAEVIFQWEWAGSASELHPQMINWEEGVITTYSFEDPEGERQLCCPADWRFEDLNDDGVLELIATGRTVFHPVGGYPRDIIQTFQWNLNKWHITSTEYLPSEYRHQVLADARRALDDGNRQLAAQLLEQAAYDDTLYSQPSHYWDWFEFKDSPDEYQRAFALFRLMAVQIVLGDEQNSNITWNKLSSTFPQDTVGGEFTVLAGMFRDELIAGKTPEQACTTVTRTIVATYPDLEDHVGYWGANNIAFYSNTICPFK